MSRLVGNEVPGPRRLWHWLPSGWRRSAIVNVGLLLLSLLLLIGVLITAVLATGEINKVWTFYTADCGDNSVTNVNVGLHLLLNAISTVIFASSNFFMQILNAPSRREVDAIHAKGDWLDIGIPSWRNAFRLSWFKAIAWLALFLTSLPIHMVFNSSMFQVNSLMGDFNITIAAESFIEAESVFSLPGASLSTSDFLHWDWHVGDRRSFQEYYDGKCETQLENVLKPANNARDWARLEPAECRSMYATRLCSGLRDYRDVLMIVKGDGWRRSDLWNLAGDQLWESLVPRDELNSLWYAAECGMLGTLENTVPLCVGRCITEVPEDESQGPWAISLNGWFPSSYKNIHMDFESEHQWNATLFSTPENVSAFGFQYDSPSLGENNGHPSLEILYCLAEPRGAACAVAISKPLLLAVVSSVFSKVVICIIVIWVLGPEESFVTPGDAVSSFISAPETESYELGPVTQDQIRKGARKRRNPTAYGPLSTTSQWVHRQSRKGSSVPWKVETGTYGILLSGIALWGTCLAAQLRFGIPLQWVKLNVGETRSILRGIPSSVTFISSVLIANTPQLYLSIWYLAYNSFITRLEMGYEWALFSTGYRPLRVTHPKGHQTSTYRLQLPYRYSIPLVVMNTLLHWLVSTALFIIVTRGDYPERSSEDASYVFDYINLPDDATVSIGTSSLPVLILVILGSIMALVPMAMAWVKLSGYMPVVGSNSRAMLAASRPSPITKIPKITGVSSDDAEGIELEQLIPASGKDLIKSKNSVAPKNLAYCLLKWGEVEMPEDWYRKFDGAGDGHPVRHLSFGTILDEPKPPTEGYLYA